MTISRSFQVFLLLQRICIGDDCAPYFFCSRCWVLLYPGACDEFFTATADDIGARILAKVMIEDEDVVKTKMLEYGPIKEDPEVRSKVEMYLERRSVLFMVRGERQTVPGSFSVHGSFCMFVLTIVHNLLAIFD